jgi:hypothetical protein
VKTQVILAWAFAFASAGCGIGAAALKGGWFAGLTAAAPALATLAGVLGYTGKTPAP